MIAEQRIATPAVLTMAEDVEDKENPEIEFPFSGITFHQGFASVGSIFGTKTEKWIFKTLAKITRGVVTNHKNHQRVEDTMWEPPTAAEAIRIPGPIAFSLLCPGWLVW